MTVPLFIKIQGRLINLAHVETISAEDETLQVGTGTEAYEFEYGSETEAGQALQRVQGCLAAKNLFVGEAA